MGGGLVTTLYGASYFMMAINTENFAGSEQFKLKVHRLIRDCKSCVPVEGFKQVLLPGEIEFKEAQERKKKGIPVEEKQWEDMVEILKSNGIKLNFRKNILSLSGARF
ncbi:hypothetical protein CEE34_02390 [Candidatus Aerophobetes bacterium Ae_b3a]|nr:MAG: hypothetical protein CEE34_02390 [Candidatus Aerophobetes bacterium Ae_b3a]